MQAQSVSAACAVAVFVCWMLLILFVADCYASTKLLFLVKRHCIPDPENRKAQDPVIWYHVNCTVRLECKYLSCNKSAPGHLVIAPVEKTIQVDIVEVSRRPEHCLLEAELRYMTESFAGAYNCMDTITGNTAVALTMKLSPLDFLVRQHCPSPNNNSPKRAATAYVHVGCNVTFICKHSGQSRQCHEKGYVSSLNVTAPHNASLHRLDGTGNCILRERIHNVTVSHEGFYSCLDKALGYDTERINLRVGSPPDPPRHLTVVYRPNRSLSLLLDKVKTEKELNDKSARWKVIFHWRIKPVECSSGGDILENGLYVACHVNLKNKNDNGAYNGLGSVLNIVHFIVDVTSVFGNVSTYTDVYIPHYVEPDSLYNVSVEDTGPTWIQLRVPLPSGLDQNTCNQMDNDSALRIHYKAKNLEEEEQQSRRADINHFHTNYNLYRNLQDDKELLKSQHLRNAIPEQTGTVMWKTIDTCEEFILINITDLQSATFYSITLTPEARYMGPPYTNTSFVSTSESVPLEGPRFDQNFYTCLTSSETATEYFKCYIYFREIPRPLRRGTIQNYTLQGTKRDWHKEDFRVSVGGQDNFFVVENLTRNATYYIKLQAFAQSGPSPVTNNSLTTSLSPGPDVAVVVREKLDGKVWNYKVTWEPQAPIDDYNVHYCFASGKLNCTTNMVKNKMTKNDSLDISHADDLQPFFFVSSKSAAAPHSLTPVSCHYETLRRPDSPELHLTEHSNSLHLKMKPRCQTNELYIYGQPKQFCYTYINTDCNSCLVTNETCVDAGDEVTRHLTLKPNSAYCVSVRAKNATGHVSTWDCQIKRKKSVDVGILSWVAVVFTLIIFAVTAACIFVCFRCSRHYRKIQSRLNPQTGESPQPRLPQPHRPKTKHIPWPTGETSLHFTAGIQNQRRIETDHIVSFMNEQATASACTSPRPADAGVSHRPTVATRYASAPLPLPVSNHTIYDTDKDSTERSTGESTQDGPDIDNDDDCLSYAYDSKLTASSADISESQSSNSLDQETDHAEEVGEGREVGPAIIVEGNDKDGDIRIVGDKGDKHEVQERQKEWLDEMENWPMSDHDNDPVVIASKIPFTLTAAQTPQTCSSGHNGLLCASNGDEVADFERGNISETLSTHHSVKTHHVKTQEHCDTPQHQSVDDQSLGENTDSSWNLRERLFPGPGVVSDCVSETSQTASSADISESQSSDSLDQETDHAKEVGEGRDVGPARIVQGNDEDGDIRIVGDKGDKHEVQEEWLEDMENWPMGDHDDDPVVIASKIPCTLTAAQTRKTCSSGHNGLLCASNDDEVADLERGNISETLSTHHFVKTHHVETQEHCDTPQHQSVDDQSLGEYTDSSWNLRERLFPGPGVISDCVSETSHTDNNNFKQVEEAKRGCTDSESVRSGSCTGCGRPWAETQNHVLSDAKTITCLCKGVENCQNGVITDHSVVSGDSTGVPSPLTRKLSDSQKGTNAALNSHCFKDESKFSHKSHILVQGRCQNSLAPEAPSYSVKTLEPTCSGLPPQPHKASDTAAGSCDVTNMYDDIDLEEVSESSELLPKLCNGSSENVGLKHAEKAQFLPNHLRSSNYLKIHSNDVSS